jgi:hypothetical protein
MTLDQFVEKNQQGLVSGFAAEQECWNIHAREFGSHWRKPYTFEGYCRAIYEQYLNLTTT